MLYILVRYRAESSGPDHQRLQQLADHCQKVPEVLQLTLLSLWEEVDNARPDSCSVGPTEATGCPCRKEVASEFAEPPDESADRPA